jgi:hypothetical protein
VTHPALRDLDFVLDHWPDLLEQRLKGTPRPWREPTMSPEARAQSDARAKAERHERSTIAPGEHPAPMHLDVVDVIVDVVATADELSECVAGALAQAPLPHASSAYADPTAHLRHVRANITAVGEAGVYNQALAEHIGEEVRRIASDVALALRLLRDGQVLRAHCPWCGGRDEKHPTGGARTLRVHETSAGPLLVCHGGACEPPEQDCGTRWRGMPAWHEGEWAWLAQRMDGAA